MKIGIVDVFVDDQERARDFYTAMLGLEVKEDAAYGESGRWLTVVSPQDRDGTALLLAPLNDAAKALQAGRRDSGTPAVSFTTDDCRRSHRELLERGVTFVSTPQAMGHGGIDAVFEDGCGNPLDLHQDAPAATGASTTQTNGPGRRGRRDGDEHGFRNSTTTPSPLLVPGGAAASDGCGRRVQRSGGRAGLCAVGAAGVVIALVCLVGVAVRGRFIPLEASILATVIVVGLAMWAAGASHALLTWRRTAHPPFASSTPP